MSANTDTSEIVIDEDHRPLWRSIRRGLLNTCPACGSGRLFKSFLKPVDVCASCETDFTAQRADDLPWGQLAKAVGIAFVGFNAVFLELASYVWPYVSSWAAWRALRDQAGPWKVLFADFYYGDIVGWWTLAAALSVALSAGAAAAVGYGLVWRKVRAAR